MSNRSTYTAVLSLCKVNETDEEKPMETLSDFARILNFCVGIAFVCANFIVFMVFMRPVMVAWVHLTNSRAYYKSTH